MGLQTSFIEQLRSSYRGRVLAMDESLQEHLSGHARWIRPDGGYFFWLEVDESIDVLELRSRAFDRGVGFQPGEVFTSTGDYKNYIRLSFAHYNEADIHKAVSRLASMLKN
jgi:DNA-binding transcriptional MocR family regulator